MKISELPDDISQPLQLILGRGYDVWLLGSRANPTPAPPNDWDFVVFGDEALMMVLRSMNPVPGLDLLVVSGGTYSKPWSTDSDSANFANWKWQQTTDNFSIYEGTKLPHDWGSQKQAIRMTL